MSRASSSVEPQARHRRHLLHLQFMAVVGALGVLQVEDVRQALGLVILGRQVLLLERAIGRRPLPRIVHPAHQVIVIGLLALAAQVGGERSALLARAFAHRVAGHAAARLECLLPAAGVALLLRRQIGLHAALPQECRNRADLAIVQPERRHLGAGHAIGADPSATPESIPSST